MIKPFMLINYTILFMPMILNLIMIFLLMNTSKINNLSPMLLMIMLILFTLMITYKMNFIFFSWMSFILFLTMIGGLMVIYMYITSLTNNQFFFFNMKYIFINFFKITPIMFIYLYMNLNNKEFLLFNLNNMDSWLINLNYNQPMYNLLYKKNNMSTYFIMMYLYYSMICIMNICYKFKAPLRQMMF